MDAFTVAAQMLGDVELSPAQLAQLRAINRKYYQELYTLLHESDGVANPIGARQESGTKRTERELTEGEVADLRAMLTSDVRAILTPEQQSVFDQK
jgi:Spy/CpxP family protein refolding chaperone